MTTPTPQQTGSGAKQGGWNFHQWHSRANPVTVYYGDFLVAEYSGRFKMLRAWLRTFGSHS